ncbi:MAG: superfamily II DNA or RNA helicase [Pseudohongiellaceae bacterium]|jgi:superfamily II DNA or RNA helicase
MPHQDLPGDSNNSRRPTVLTSELTLDQLRRLAELAARFTEQTPQRGRHYAADGRVHGMRCDSHKIRASVRGNNCDYQTRWDDTEAGWQPSCTCPVAPRCKHAYAVVCAALGDTLAGGTPRQAWMDELLPAPPAEPAQPPSSEEATVPATEVLPVMAATPAMPEMPPIAVVPAEPVAEDPASSEAEPDADADATDEAPEQAPDTPALTQRQRSALFRLQSSPDWIDRAHALADLLAKHPRFASAAFAPPLSDLAEIDDPELRCFLVAKELYKHLGPRLPAALAPFLERTDVAERDDTRHQTSLAEHIAAWVGSQNQRSPRSLRLELQLRQLPDQGAVVAVSALLTSQRIDDETRSGLQLRQLLADANREPDWLPCEQRDLLAVLLEPLLAGSVPDFEHFFEFSGSALLRLVLAVADNPLVTWADDIPVQLVDAAGIEAGASPRLAPDMVTIGPVLSNESGEPRVVLEHTLNGGRVLLPSEHVVLRCTASTRREPTLVLTRGAFCSTQGDPPAVLSQLLESSGGFDPTPPAMRALVEPLARTFPGFRNSLEGHTRVHQVHLLVSLDLTDDDWLQCRAYASTDPDWLPSQPQAEDSKLFEWMPDGRWVVRTDEDTAASDEVPANDELQRVTEADEQFESNTEILDAEVLDPEAGNSDAVDPDAPHSDDAQATELSSDTDVAEPDSELIFFEEPDPKTVDALGLWLQRFRRGIVKQRNLRSLPASSSGAGFQLRLSARTAGSFSEAWDLRPHGVAWFGNETVRRLLTAPSAAAPRLRVVSSGVDWFTVSSTWENEGAALTEAELSKLRDADTRFVRLPSGWARKDEAQKHDDAAAILAELGIEPGVDEQPVSLLQLAHANPEALLALEAPEGSEELLRPVRELREKVAAFAGLPRVHVPETINATLRPYQRDGLDFLSYTSDLKLGSILADDMGLGKTLQALAWIARFIEQDPEGGPTLVVCPASVMHNWEREAERFAPQMRVLALTAGGERHLQREQIPAHDLVLTNYALLRRDSEELTEIPWRVVILDEAQNIKNPDAAVSRAARALHADYRLALTGTPLENRALDLWSIQSFLNPGYLGTRASFTRHYDRPDAPPYARALLAAKLRPVMVRRLKSQVAPELPPRIEEQLDCVLSPGQRQLYLAELAKGRALLDELSHSGGVRRNKISILAVLTRLRQICCHPALVGGKESLGSGKFDAFFELLEPLLGEGHKVLVFSQFVQCLKRVAEVMKTRGIPYHMLTGSSRNRGDIVAAFEADTEASAFLVSLKAGGTGLNLTAASYVVLFDPWWNPAVEAQAIDRTHRIGQDRTVIAYRLVAQGTIEERIRELQQSKASLARGLLGEDGFAKTLSRDDLDYLLADV